LTTCVATTSGGADAFGLLHVRFFVDVEQVDSENEMSGAAMKRKQNRLYFIFEATSAATRLAASSYGWYEQAKMLRAPSISRLLRNGWDTTNLNQPC
jgi:hypothetical protein